MKRFICLLVECRDSHYLPLHHQRTCLTGWCRQWSASPVVSIQFYSHGASCENHHGLLAGLCHMQSMLVFVKHTGPSANNTMQRQLKLELILLLWCVPRFSNGLHVCCSASTVCVRMWFLWRIHCNAQKKNCISLLLKGQMVMRAGSRSTQGLSGTFSKQWGTTSRDSRNPCWLSIYMKSLSTFWVSPAGCGSSSDSPHVSPRNWDCSPRKSFSPPSP